MLNKFIIFLVFLSVTLGVSAQKVKDQGAQVPLDKEVVFGTLPNGLKYYIRHNEVPKERAEYYIVHNVGSMLENPDQNGLAHFTEHMAFNGTKNFPGKGILNFMELNGVAFGHNVNAFTSYDVTAYMLSKVPTTREGLIDTSLMILHDWSGFISMEDKEIDAERGVIHEEWRTGRTADRRLRKKVAPALYNGTKYVEHDVIGDINVIDNHKYQTIRDFYHDWYRPDLQALIVVGDINPTEIEAKIKNIFSDIPKRKNPKERYYIEIPDNEQPLISVATDPEASRIMVQILYKHNVVENKDKEMSYLKKQVMSSLYEIMFNQRLNELTQTAHPPFVFAYNYYTDFARRKAAYYSVGSANPGEIDLTLTTLLLENKRVKEFGFTASELERAKAELLKQTETQFNERNKTESGDFVWTYFSHFLANEPAPGIEFMYNFTKTTLPLIKLEEVNNLAKERITGKNMVVTITGPGKEGEVLFKESDVLAIIEKANTTPVEAYTESVSDEPLMKDKPTGFKLLNETTENGITVFKYENGVTVVVKPTDFKDDEILMSAYSFGGYSVVSDEDLPSALMASTIVSMSGVGNFNNVDLQKKLSGKIVEVTPFIDRDDEGFDGKCSPDELETMLQLTWLYFNAPVKDETAYSAYMQRISSLLENRSLDPNSKFRDTISVISSDRHPRVQPFNKDFIAKVNLDKLYAIYQDRFKDAKDFVFVFVGNIDLERSRSLFDTYLGSLPSGGRIETFKDNMIRPPKQIVEKEVNFKLEVEKSTVFVDFFEQVDYTAENLILSSAIKYILGLRYTETIREEEGGTYGVRVSNELNRYPVGSSHFKMMFDCAPEKSEHLRSIVYREIEKLKKEGPTEEDFKKTIEYLKKTRQEQLRENSYWQSALIKKYYYGFDPTLEVNYEKIVESLTKEMIQTGAKTFFNPDKYIQIVLMPLE